MKKNKKQKEKTLFFFSLGHLLFLVFFILFFECEFLSVIISSSWRTSFTIAYKAHLLAKNYVSFLLSENFFILPSFLKNMFTKI